MAATSLLAASGEESDFGQDLARLLGMLWQRLRVRLSSSAMADYVAKRFRRQFFVSYNVPATGAGAGDEAEARVSFQKLLVDELESRLDACAIDAAS